MTNEQITSFFHDAFAELATGITTRWKEGSTRMLSSTGTPTNELEESARQVAVGAVMTWFQLRLLREIATQESDA